MPCNSAPIQLNGNIAITCTILKIVVASAVKAKFGALFVSAKETRVVCLILSELGHPPPPIPVHIDNTAAVGTVHRTTKRHRSRLMEMRYYWLLNQASQNYFKFYHQPGTKLLAKYPREAYTGPIHTYVCPYYLCMQNSPTLLLRAAQPTVQQGCTEILGDPYTKGIPLPRIPISRTPGRDPQLANLVNMRPAQYTGYHNPNIYVPLYPFTGLNV